MGSRSDTLAHGLFLGKVAGRIEGYFMDQQVQPDFPDPSALKKWHTDDLYELAAALRRTILWTVSQNGGHLASNLGVVELTIALLREFDFDPSHPGHDSIIFDVGHQSYTYKLLTGRDKAFSTLRLRDGLSGFPKTTESPWDYFNTGHSSTSISAAEGLGRAKLHRHEDGKVIALIGDGAMGAGMAFEALNDLSGPRDNLIVILNDNLMSIDANVGSVSKILGHLRVNSSYLHLKKVVQEALQKIPGIGPYLVRKIKKIKALDRFFARRKGLFFEDMGFSYYGPIDGHDLEDLSRNLKAVHQLRGPSVVHVVTKKGKGFREAELAPEKYHGVAPFAVERDEGDGRFSYHLTPLTKEEQDRTKAKEKVETFTQFAGRTLLAMAKEDPNIFAITAAMTSGTGLADFAETYPDRFFDVGIAEQHAVTLGAGLAAGGVKPYVALYSTFLQRALDQILHDVCLQNLPVRFLIDHSGAVSQDGETHQGYYDLALLQALPHMEVFEPADQEDLSLLLRYSLTATGPMAIRYPKEGMPHLPALEDLRKEILASSSSWKDLILTARKLPLSPTTASGSLKSSSPSVSPRSAKASSSSPSPRDQGPDLTIVALGSMTSRALALGPALADQGWKAELFSVVRSKNFPIDVILKSVSESHRLVTIEESVLPGSFGSCLNLRLMAEGVSFLHCPLGFQNVLMGQAKRSELLTEAGLDPEGIFQAIQDFMKRSS